MNVRALRGNLLRIVIVGTVVIGVAIWLLTELLLGHSSVRVAQAASVRYEYDRTPTGSICGTTGPSPNQMEIQVLRKNSGTEIEIEVRKCDGSSFSKNGEVALIIDGQQYGSRDSYPSGISEIEMDFDPVDKGIYGFHTYQAYVYSSDQPTIPKHTGVIRVWEEYDLPTDVQDDLIYQIDPANTPVCGNIVALELVQYSSPRMLEAEITKCVGGTFAQDGYFYLASDGIPFLGPIHYDSGVNVIFRQFDPADYGLALQSHGYQAIFYTDDQPTLAKVSGLVNAIGQAPTPTNTPTNTPTSTSTNMATSTPTSTEPAANTVTPTPTATEEGTSADTPMPTVTPTATTQDTPNADVQIEALDITGGSGATLVIPIKVKPLNGRSVGAVSLELRYDPQVAEAVGCTADPTHGFGIGACNYNYDNDRAGTDAIRINVASATGVTGEQSMAEVSFRLVGQTGSNGPVTLSVNTLTDPAGQPLIPGLRQGHLTVGDQSATPTLRFANDQNSGGAGSYFLLIGEQFPPNTQIAILIGGKFIATIQTDGNGIFTLLIATLAETPMGEYLVTTDQPASRSATLAINQAAPLPRPSDVGDGVNQVEFGGARIFLPMLEH